MLEVLIQGSINGFMRFLGLAFRCVGHFKFFVLAVCS